MSMKGLQPILSCLFGVIKIIFFLAVHGAPGDPAWPGQGCHQDLVDHNMISEM